MDKSSAYVHCFLFLGRVQNTYFYKMKIIVTWFFLFVSSITCLAQIRLDKLVIKSGETYQIANSDILVVDTLIMQDGSKLILNRAKADNFIHAKVIKIGRKCEIIGNGINGENGIKGLGGYTATGPCKDGIPAKSGTAGTSATAGVNLYLYFGKMTVADKLLIELSGGNGGDGGSGGNGGGGSPGTRLCAGGNGGYGGSGGAGGDGGDAGNLTLSCPVCPDLRAWVGNNITVRSYGGNGGLGGEGGLGGFAGLVSAGNTSKDGEQGAKGKEGERGQHGKNGAINFELD